MISLFYKQAKTPKSQALFDQSYPFILSWSYYYLPDKNLLQQKLSEWTQEFENTQAIRETVNRGSDEVNHV